MSRTNGIITASGLQEQMTLLDSLPGMAYRCRNAKNWSMLFVSEGCTELSGYAPEALLGGRPHWGDFIHPEDREAVWQSVQEAIERGKRFELQYRLITRDKQHRWVWERGRALESEEYGTAIEGFVTDITPLRQKELELERSRAFATAIVEGAAEGIVLVDARFQIESLNQAASLMFGIASSAAGGSDIRDLLPTADRAEFESGARKHRESESSDLFNGGLEMNGRRADGSEFPIHLNVRELRFEQEYRYAAFIRDISEQRAKTEKIRQQHEQLHATVESSPIGITMADKELRLIAVNAAFANMLGYDAKALIGRRPSEFTHPDDIDDTDGAAIASFASGSDHYSIGKRYLHRDGHIVHATLNVAVGHDSDGNAAFLVANIEDQTERLGIETQLREQQDQLMRLDRLSMLGEMMAGVAHEINQPLTAISTYAQSGLRFMDPRNPKPDRLREALTKLSEQARRAGAVVDRIRDLARQDVTKNELLSINHLIKKVEDLAIVDSRARGVKIRLDLGENLPPVWCDLIQIQQVILNLIRNSVDSMEASDFCNCNEVILRTSTAEDGSVMISVIDCGAGVSEEAAADIFQPFSTHKRSGLGLGLSISRSIVTAHGGQLDYHNNPSAGATFFLTLPQSPGDITHE